MATIFRYPFPILINYLTENLTAINARVSLDDNGTPTNLREDDLVRIRTVLNEAYAPNTRSSYGTGLLIFHIFCDTKDIGEEHRAPVDPMVLSSFVSQLVGTYGGQTIRNYIYGIRAWHIIHGATWKVNDSEIDALLKAGDKLAPKEARKREKKPWTIDYLTKICNALNPKDPKDAAIHACLTTAFFLGNRAVRGSHRSQPERLRS